MAKEIERKFLVADDGWRSMVSEVHEIKQGYLSTRPEAVVRVRIKDREAFLTVKGITRGIERHEWEYQIPVDDATLMLQNIEPSTVVISKTRHIVVYDGMCWEIDVFHGSHEGLVLAEIELDSPEREVTLPPFVGPEVTRDPRYFNSVLSQKTAER